MKKILTGALVALAFVGSVFALDMKVDAGISFPISTYSVTQSYTVLGVTTSTKYTSTTNDFGLYADADIFFTKLLGLGLNTNFGFPLQTKLSSGDTSTTTKFGTTENGIKTTAFEFNGLLGCAIRILNSKKMFFIVTPGLDWDIMTTTTAMSGDNYTSTNKTTCTYFGLGAEAQFGYKVTKNLAISAEVLLAWDFASSGNSSSSTTVSGRTTSSSTSLDSDNLGKPFIFMPKIGVSYIF